MTTRPFHPRVEDCTSARLLDFESLRNDIVTGVPHAPSYGRHDSLDRQISMLEQEFSGQIRLKFVHAVLNVLLRRKIEVGNVYRQFNALWQAHGDILIETLDSRWLVSACDTLSDHCPDADEASLAISFSLFANTLKLAETERLLTEPGAADPARVSGRTPLFDGMKAFVPGGGDMPANLLDRLDRTLRADSLAGRIGRELVCRALSDDTVFTRLARFQVRHVWRGYLPSAPAQRAARAPAQPMAAGAAGTPGYILLNDTGRLGASFHAGTVYACTAIRQNLARRGLHEVGWANDRAAFDALLAGAGQRPALVVLNGEGTLHHGAARAAELLEICVRARDRGLRIAVINSVWEGNPPAMTGALGCADLVHVRDSLSLAALPQGLAATVTPDVSIPLFLQTLRDGQFQPPRHARAVIDSVVPETSAALLRFAEENRLPFHAMSIGNLRSVRDSVAQRSGPVWPRLLQATDVMTARTWVTGRFHGLIAALCAGRPVCALRSNTAKVEGFLRDAGLADACLLGPDWTTALPEDQRTQLEQRFEMQQTEEFIQRRETFLKAADARITAMFDAVAALPNA